MVSGGVVSGACTAAGTAVQMVGVQAAPVLSTPYPSPKTQVPRVLMAAPARYTPRRGEQAYPPHAPEPLAPESADQNGALGAVNTAHPGAKLPETAGLLVNTKGDFAVPPEADRFVSITPAIRSATSQGIRVSDLTSRWELLIKNDQDISSPPRTSPPRKSLSPSIPSSPFLAVFNKPVSPITSEVADDVSDKEAELANRMKGNARVLGVLTDGNEVATTGQQVQTEVRVDLALPSFEPFQPIYKPDVVADLELHLSQKAQSDSQPQSHNHQAQNDGGNVPQAPDNHFQLNPVEFTNISSIQGLQLEATERVSKSVILLPSATLASSTPHCSQSQPLETSLGFVSEAAESKATVVPSGYQTPAGRSMPIVCAQAVHTSSKILRDASCQTEISSSMTTGQNLLRLSSSNDTELVCSETGLVDETSNDTPVPFADQHPLQPSDIWEVYLKYQHTGVHPGSPIVSGMTPRSRCSDSSQSMTNETTDLSRPPSQPSVSDWSRPPSSVRFMSPGMSHGGSSPGGCSPLHRPQTHAASHNTAKSSSSLNPEKSREVSLSFHNGERKCESPRGMRKESNNKQIQSPLNPPLVLPPSTIPSLAPLGSSRLRSRDSSPTRHSMALPPRHPRAVSLTPPKNAREQQCDETLQMLQETLTSRKASHGEEVAFLEKEIPMADEKGNERIEGDSQVQSEDHGDDSAPAMKVHGPHSSSIRCCRDRGLAVCARLLLSRQRLKQAATSHSASGASMEAKVAVDLGGMKKEGEGQGTAQLCADNGKEAVGECTHFTQTQPQATLVGANRTLIFQAEGDGEQSTNGGQSEDHKMLLLTVCDHAQQELANAVQQTRESQKLLPLAGTEDDSDEHVEVGGLPGAPEHSVCDGKLIVKNASLPNPEKVYEGDEDTEDQEWLDVWSWDGAVHHDGQEATPDNSLNLALVAAFLSSRRSRSAQSPLRPKGLLCATRGPDGASVDAEETGSLFSQATSHQDKTPHLSMGGDRSPGISTSSVESSPTYCSSASAGVFTPVHLHVANSPHTSSSGKGRACERATPRLRLCTSYNHDTGSWTCSQD